MDKKAKKKVLQQIPYGAYVVGTKAEDGADHLMFGTWLMQTSFKPPLVAFALSEGSRTLANVRREKAFAVSLLAPGMEGLAQDVLDEAFDKGKTDRTPSRLPVVRDGAGWIDCKFLEVGDRGGHRHGLADVVDTARRPHPGGRRPRTNGSCRGRSATRNTYRRWSPVGAGRFHD